MTQPLPHSTVNKDDKVIKILMLEDNENDAELIQMHLKASFLNIVSKLVSNKADYIQTLENEEFDVILSDHKMPQFSSLEALRIRNEIKFHVPFILVTGTIPEEYAVTILQEGANDYILKDRPQRLVTAIKEAIKKQKAITDKILADQELKMINERLKLVGKATADAIWDWDLLTNRLVWGEGYETLFGYKIIDIIPGLSTWTEHIHPKDHARVCNNIVEVIKDKTQSHWVDEYEYKRLNGSYAMVLDRGIVLRDENDVAYRMVGAMQDITKIKVLERKISSQEIFHQKQNTEIAIQSQEEERKYIGQELHDNISQVLAFSKMMIDTARNTPEMHEECLNKSYEGINMAIEEVRNLSHRLVPPVFNDKNNFLDAVNDLVANIQISGLIDITVDIPTKGKFILSKEKIKLTFYRIIQEQLNNILKHAKATKASITLMVTKNTYQLVITDDGLGFDCNTKRNGIGLRNIESRVEVHSGKMKIISGPGEGYTLMVEIPIK